MSGRPAGANGARRGEQGYNLVVLVMVIAVMNIVIAAMLPLWSQAIRHDKEEELIFRGLQYAEALRVFQHRFQRWPTRLQELVGIKPRSIRQLWKDPMVDDGKWQLIFRGQPTPLTPPPDGDTGRNNRRHRGDPDITPATGIDQEGHAFGPIIGVYSRSTQKSIEIWNGRQKYNEWRFTADLLTTGSQFAGARVPSQKPVFARWIGRPMRTFGGLNQPPSGPNGPTGPQSMPDCPGCPPPPPKPPTKQTPSKQ